VNTAKDSTKRSGIMITLNRLLCGMKMGHSVKFVYTTSMEIVMHLEKLTKRASVHHSRIKMASVITALKSLRSSQIRMLGKSVDTSDSDHMNAFHKGMAAGFECAADMIEIEFYSIIQKVKDAESEIIEKEIAS